MKLNRIIAAIIVCFSLNSCHKDNYLDYNELIIGDWYCFSSETSSYRSFSGMGSYNEIGYDKETGWINARGTYNVYDDKVIYQRLMPDGSSSLHENVIKIENDQMTLIDKNLVYNRINKNFDIRGEFSFKDVLVNVEHKDASQEITLPSGSIVKLSDILSETKIKELMGQFFDYVSFKDNWILEHTMNGETFTKKYFLNNNILDFGFAEYDNLTISSSTLAFPDVDNEHLYIIFDGNTSFEGFLINILRMENPDIEITSEYIKEIRQLIINERPISVNAIITLENRK